MSQFVVLPQNYENNSKDLWLQIEYNINENFWNFMRNTKMWHRDTKLANVVGKIALVGFLSVVTAKCNKGKLYHKMRYACIQCSYDKK